MSTNTYAIRLSGVGGQGLVVGAKVLADALMREGKTVAQSQSYEPVSRGGLSRSDLVVGDGLIDYPLVTTLDLLLVAEQSALAVSQSIIAADGIVLCDSERSPQPPQGEGNYRVHSLPLTDTARRLGNIRMANMVALGAMAVLSQRCRTESLQQAVQAQMSKRYWEDAAEAVRAGAELAQA